MLLSAPRSAQSGALHRVSIFLHIEAAEAAEVRREQQPIIREDLWPCLCLLGDRHRVWSLGRHLAGLKTHACYRRDVLLYT